MKGFVGQPVLADMGMAVKRGWNPVCEALLNSYSTARLQTSASWNPLWDLMSVM